VAPAGDCLSVDLSKTARQIRLFLQVCLHVVQTETDKGFVCQRDWELHS
jgi:hypothetical protein